MNGGSRPRPESGIELYAWLFMRISGILLLVLALGHLAIMHLIHDIDEISYQFVAERFRTPFWRTYDLVMLWLALIHGLNGARTLIQDYIGARGWRVFCLSSLYVVGLLFLVLGSLVIVTFQLGGNP